MLNNVMLNLIQHLSPSGIAGRARNDAKEKPAMTQKTRDSFHFPDRSAMKVL